LRLTSNLNNNPGIARHHSLVHRIEILSCLLLFSLTLFYGIPSLYGTNNVANATSSSIALTLAARPPILPADGGSYGSLVLEFRNTTSGAPYIPQTNLTIQLSSTNPQTGTVPQSIMFPQGALFVTANFTTTSSPGSTTVNAFLAGYSPATTTVSTVFTGGMPAVLKVYMSPPVVPPNALITSSVIVMVVDSLGNPVKLGSPLTVSLSSSDSQTGSVPPSITINKGSSYGEATFTPTYIAGQSVITASAPGLSTGNALMTTVGPIARRLVVTVAPNAILANGADYATVSVQLQDNNSQTPAPAPANVNVVITSNNTLVGQVQSTLITIPRGQSYALVNVTSGGTPGTANITAAAQGYLKGSALLTADKPTGKMPNRLSVSFLPSTLLPNNQTYLDAAVVQLQWLNASSGASVPAVNSSGIVTVYARSSNNATMAVDPQPITIVSGQSHAFTSITSSFLPGTAVVTAQAKDLSPDTESLLSFGLTSNALIVSAGPQLLLADGESYNLTVGLINQATGDPASAPVATIVNLATTSSVVGQMKQSFVTIPAGQSFTTVGFTSSGLPGATEITATASNYATGNANLTLINAEATNLGIYAAPGVVIANGHAYQNLVVQLQDGSNNPQKTDVPVNVSLTSNTVSSGRVTSQITVEPGWTFALASFDTTTLPGGINITAFANGFQYAKTNISSIVLPMSAHLSLSAPSVQVGGRINATVTVEASNQPLAGANVTWETTSGTLVGEENQTNAAGIASTLVMVGAVQGPLRVSAIISMPGYQTLNVNATTQVITLVTTTQTTQNNGNLFGIPFLGMTLGGVPVWAIIVIAAGGAGGGFFYMKRIRGGGFQYQDEE
jgi:hypothetical protein